MSEQTAAGVRVNVYGRGEATIETGLPVLNRLLARLAEVARFDLVLDIEPGDTQAEVEAAAGALGQAVTEALPEGSRRHGSAVVPADEALAHVALEVSGRPLVVSNVDLSASHVAGLQGDVVARFLQELAEGAGLTVHVRLIDGKDTEHVLETIFKSLGVALAQAGRQRG